MNKEKLLILMTDIILAKVIIHLLTLIMKLHLWANEYYKNVLEETASLNYNEKYHLSSDEGGMLGNPTFLISRFKEERLHFTYIGLLSRDSIEKFILGRVLTWKLLNEDYSKRTQIIIS